jgi:hypothetical protein
MSTAQYRAQVALLVRILPLLASEPAFALKGGTAINLFWRDLPRLSVDLDLTYLPLADRPTSLAGIDAALRRLADLIRVRIEGAAVDPQGGPEGALKLLIRAGGTQVKVEVTPVLRGVVFDPEVWAVSPRVEAAFGFAETTLVSFADLYAGKMVAALDRQHPRDLFDVRDLLANEGLTRPLMDAFLVYLVSHNRPMAEVLAPNRKDLSEEFARTFAGMAEAPVELDELVAARESDHRNPRGPDRRGPDFPLGREDRSTGLVPGGPAASRRLAGGPVAAHQLGAPERSAASGACRSAQGGP